MQKQTALWAALVVALVVGLFAPAFRASAKEDMDLMQMMMQAKTPADHEKLAAQYDQEAAEARAKAATHKKMAEEVRDGKYGGSLLAKTHYDTHCDALVSSFTTTAGEYAGLAMAEREMAKQMK